MRRILLALLLLGGATSASAQVFVPGHSGFVSTPAGTGTLNPSGGPCTATEIAVWSAANTLTCYTDFTWVNTSRLLLAADATASTITGSAADAGIIASYNVEIADGDYTFVGGGQGVSISGGTFAVGAVSSSDTIINDGASYAGLLGTSGSSILSGGYNAIIGSSCSALGGDTIANGCNLAVGDTSASYSAIAGTSFSSINGGTYAFIGGCSDCLIDGTNGGGDGSYAAIIGSSGVTVSGLYSAIAASSGGTIGSGSTESFIAAASGGDSIGTGCTNCAVIAGGTVANSLGGSVALAGGAATVSSQVALGGMLTLASVTFTGLGAFPNGTMMYCTDCDPTATLLACTHVAAQTGAFAYRVAGAWKCMG